jgi:hypothetical protein
MLKRAPSKVTFILPDDVGPVSVVGDFNGWDPAAHPLRRRSNATRSVAVDLPPGRYAFRYLADGQGFFDEPEADAVEANGYGDTHSLLVVA